MNRLEVSIKEAHLRCPHCHAPLKIVSELSRDGELKGMECPACSKPFDVEVRSCIRYITRPAPVPSIQVVNNVIERFIALWGEYPSPRRQKEVARDLTKEEAQCIRRLKGVVFYAFSQGLSSEDIELIRAAAGIFQQTGRLSQSTPQIPIEVHASKVVEDLTPSNISNRLEETELL